MRIGLAGSVACVMLGGPHRSIVAGGRIWWFEAHPHCGPVVLDSDGEIAKRQPGQKSPFWTAVNQWYRQGQRVTERSECLWHHEPEELFDPIVFEGVEIPRMLMFRGYGPTPPDEPVMSEVIRQRVREVNERIQGKGAR